jgi:hypothetical protein
MVGTFGGALDARKIDAAQAAESPESQTLHCNTVISCFFDKHFVPDVGPERRPARGQRR